MTSEGDIKPLWKCLSLGRALGRHSHKTCSEVSVSSSMVGFVKYHLKKIEQWPVRKSVEILALYLFIDGISLVLFFF